ncbi:hypothetical protein P0W64_05880 [Tsukamurella sp. 8F]|uniref:hypothetical protein n=1 Tax=unclassified Tsukamurella TaxID=2633480 RepID=UPI0023B8C484|nr:MULTISPECIES: hypothetical protein [unclassified Tsukamurella]MDF0528474.1 hypothetical protein [Tsukamurella sp. 8J]MDF0586300.1 hypothetical protein [Tsukamurella sp. 8F]
MAGRALAVFAAAVLTAGCSPVPPAVTGRFVSLPDSAGGHPAAFTWTPDGGLRPGLTIVDATAGAPSDCTIGWPVTASDGHRGYLTAGHCSGGLGGATWVYTDGGARGRMDLGPYVLHEDDTLHDGTMVDAAAAFLPADTPPERWGTSVAGHPIAGVLAPREVAGLPRGTPVCMLGARAGAVCGPLLDADTKTLHWGGYAVDGDSGAALFVVNPDRSVCALGVLHDGPTDRDNTVAYVDPALQRWHLTIPVSAQAERC